MLNRLQLSTQYRKIPGLVKAKLFRLGVNDQVRDTRDVNFVEYKETTREKVDAVDGPTNVKSATIIPMGQ